MSKNKLGHFIGNYYEGFGVVEIYEKNGNVIIYRSDTKEAVTVVIPRSDSGFKLEPVKEQS